MDNCDITVNIIINDSIMAKNSKVICSNSNEKTFLLGEGTKIKL